MSKMSLLESLTFERQGREQHLKLIVVNIIFNFLNPLQGDRAYE